MCYNNVNNFIVVELFKRIKVRRIPNSCVFHFIPSVVLKNVSKNNDNSC